MKLSIVVAVYNHEKYIEQTMKSILEQDIKDDFEVLIGEDCSTDNTRSILKSIEAMCPSNYHFFYREKNYGSEKNFTDLYERMQGEYFAVIEGDDYWIEKTKIQQQIDFLDKHKNYIACAHNVEVVNEKSEKINILYPECKKEEYTIYDYLSGILPGQTASILSRNYFLNKKMNKSILSVPYYAGDRRKAFFLSSNGKIYCFQKQWSAYRYVISSGESFSANIKENKTTHEKDVIYAKAQMEYAKMIHNTDSQKVSEILYMLSLYGALKFNIDGISVKSILFELLKCRYKGFIISNLIKYKLARYKKKDARTQKYVK